MLAPLACLYPDEKKIDSELRDFVEKILYAINTEVNAHERMFSTARMNFAHAKTKEETIQAMEDMRTHAEVHDILEEDRIAINQKLNSVILRQKQREEEDMRRLRRQIRK